MSTESVEKRSNPRAQYFLVHQVGDYVPVFAFRPEDDATAFAVVVTDAAEGGVQVLSAQGTEFDVERYELEVMGDSPDVVSKRIMCVVHRIWSRQDGMYTRSGFSFVGDTGQSKDLRSKLASSEHGLLRCVLRPVAQTA